MASCQKEWARVIKRHKATTPGKDERETRERVGFRVAERRKGQIKKEEGKRENGCDRQGIWNLETGRYLHQRL
jgi:hypothetical protein